ncbi:MAG TPA: PEP-CTERM sorting domain-containing protein [Alphaproteobacteria bacterium]|nr:PEP-CTERM sorting domain-containing protein [Alphaproteobacteria bacterium]
MKKTILCFSLISAFVLNTYSQSSQITWSSVQYISGDSDISTMGTLFGTWSPYLEVSGGGSITANGVTFVANDLPDFSIPSYFEGQYTGFGSPGTADANYNTLLEGAQFSNNGTGGTFSFGGLTPGNTYQVEIWVEDTRNIGNRRWENVYENSYGDSGTSSALTFPADGSSPDLGQYDIGTFVANSAGAETLNFETWCSVGGNQCAQVNLFQVRDLTPAPEPSALALMAVSGAAILVRFRRRS